MVSFAANFNLNQEVVCCKTETLRDQTGCGGAEASRTGHAGGRCHLADRYFGTAALPVDEAIRQHAVGSGTPTQAAAGRERAAQEAGRETEPGQGHSAGRGIKNVWSAPALQGERCRSEPCQFA